MDHLLGQLPPTQAELAEQLRSLTAGLRVLIESMQAEIDKLKRELSRDSNNSSKPPSSDTLTQRAAQAARRQGWKKEKGKRKAGKQPGAPGRHLAQVDASDVVVVPRPTACQDCGASGVDGVAGGAAAPSQGTAGGVWVLGGTARPPSLRRGDRCR